ncbi:glycosyl hydrolase 115 family protein [Flavobacterium subsaxonicum]|uniref:Glycosyhydrolase n=1 Tax=Flavobacterium subsaxonicum WB 4.1-42 = DSM 21790 TaxID=1121898 RepID=A0A0A2MS76_9FLAO|nr:glycosyl hydrolase 115 family protein [Flavobacterium subsaxonicum]KGO95154.1 glycosyhydrolase [Flavobacterium subsaxonicum WB 4.1-42 = DSM 21790]
MSKVLLFFFSILYINATAQSLVTDKSNGSGFPVVFKGEATSILIDSKDDSLINIVANLFISDVERVSGKRPKLTTKPDTNKNIIIIGTVANSSYIKELVKTKKLNVETLTGQWDGYTIQVVNNPFKGVKQALVIVGSNKRGAAYGTLEISKQMGVSPWYWWADVPVKKKSEIFVNVATPISDAPKVKYRGIFINDEAPAFTGWAKEKFGGLNHKTYEKVFELLLRLKANYLWPAMWGSAFNDDDKLNPVLADRWGIVMGTSHHEPMQRAQQEWKRYGKGAWDYTKNESVLRDFWRKGIQNMGTHESIVTVGMRGDGDEPMTEGTATALLEKIVADQRKILEEITGKPASETPQLWALYKEVQDYYDKGMRVPDDVTLLLCDDNWGNIRKLPKVDDKIRKGGYGIYYHFDYVGDPRNYKWINTNNIARVYEQMHLAWEYNARQIWIVNVGDIKPMEFPISFFLDYAWNPDKWTPDNLRTYYTNWAADQFGSQYANSIGEVVREYGQLAARRKPELVDSSTYSLQHYNEAENVVATYNALLEKAEKIQQQLPAEYHDAYFQLVLHPIRANANLHQMYYAAAQNNRYAAANDKKANAYADTVKELFKKDSVISVQYNTMNNGKWNHFMDQVHIGYTSWNDPKTDIMPKVTYVPETSKATLPVEAAVADKSAQSEAAKDTGTAFFEKNGYVAIDAEHFTNAINTNGITWKILQDIGRTASGITPFPVTAPKQQPGGNNPHLEYTFYIYEEGKASVAAYFSPTLNFHNAADGLRYAISIDNETPKIVGINASPDAAVWRGWVADNCIVKTTSHSILKPGKHTLKFWMVDPAVVLQKIVIDFGGVKQSYLGPPETRTVKP